MHSFIYVPIIYMCQRRLSYVVPPRFPKPRRVLLISFNFLPTFTIQSKGDSVGGNSGKGGSGGGGGEQLWQLFA